MTQALYESSIKSLPLLGRGKVRDIYAIDADKLLIVTSDRLSAFDVVLPDPIPRKGTVLTFTTVYRAPLPVFKEMLPYVIAIVDMDEGFRVMANALPQVQQGPLAIGARVQIGFTDVHGMALPVLQQLLEVGQ